MTTLPNLKKGITQDLTPPAVDTQISPISIPDGTTLLTTKLHNEIVDNEDQIIDYISGDNSPNFIPQLAIEDLISDLAAKEDSLGFTPENIANKDVANGYAGLDAGGLLDILQIPGGITASKISSGTVDNTEFDTLNGVTSSIQTQLDGKEPSLGFTPENLANKGATNGYAPLVSSLVPIPNLGTGTPDGTKFLRDDGIFVTPTGIGEINTASNVGIAGVGLFKQKTIFDLEFKNINAGSSKITITDDIVNNEVDIDVVEANLTTVEKTANKGANNGYAGLDATSKLLIANFPTGTALQVLRRDAANTALEFTDPTVGVGENNTSSNSIVDSPTEKGLVLAKSGVDLPFRVVAIGSTNLSITSDIDKVTLDVIPANLSGIPQSGITNLTTDLSNKQPLDSDLTAIAGLVPVNDDIIQRKADEWINRTPAQFKTDLVLVKADVGLGNVDNTSDINKPVSTAQQTALDGKEDSLGFTPEDSANKGALNGYAPLVSSLVPIPNLGTGTPDGTKFLRDDGVFAVPTGGLLPDLSNMTSPTIPPVDLDLNSHQLLGVTKIVFNLSDTSIAADIFIGLRYDVGLNKEHVFFTENSGSPLFVISAVQTSLNTSLNMVNHKIINVLDPTNSQDVVTKAFADANYLPDNLGNHTATQNLEMADNSIIDVGNIQFRETISIPSNVAGIGFDNLGNRMRFNVPIANIYLFAENGSTSGIVIDPINGIDVNDKSLSRVDTLESRASNPLNIDVITALQLLNIQFQGTTEWTISNTTITGKSIFLNADLIFNDSVSTPTENGQFSRNGADVFVFSGGVARNLSDISATSFIGFSADDNLRMVDNTIFFDTAQTHFIKSDTIGINYETAALKNHTFSSPNGDFLELIELDAGSRRIDVKNNFMINVGKLVLTGQTDGHILGTSEIFQNITNEEIRYISKNSNHIFEGDTTGKLLTIKDSGDGGLLEEIGFIHFNSVTVQTLSANGDFQLVGNDMKVFSGGVARNLSLVGVGIEFFGSWTATHNAGAQLLDNLGKLTISNTTTDPSLDGQFSRNGNVLGLQIPEFEVVREISDDAEFAELTITKRDTGILDDNIANLNFRFHDPTPTDVFRDVARLSTSVDIDAGKLDFEVMANFDIILVKAISIKGAQSTASAQITMNESVDFADSSVFNAAVTMNQLVTMNNAVTINAILDMNADVDMNGNDINMLGGDILGVGDITMAGSGSTIDMVGGKITELVDPTNDQDAVTKKFADENYLGPTFQIIKSVDEIRSNTTTLADDSELKFSAKANTRYFYMCFPSFTGDPAGDFKLSFSVPSGAVIFHQTGDWTQGATSFADATAVDVHNTTSQTFPDPAALHGIINIGSTAGQVSLQWAQLTLDPNNTTMIRGAALMVWEV